MKITAVLWGYEDDQNSIDPLEASDGNISYWTNRVDDSSPEFIDELKNYTGLYMFLYKGNVPADAPWDGRYEPVEDAYVSSTWSADRLKEIAARLADVSPADVQLVNA